VVELVVDEGDVEPPRVEELGQLQHGRHVALRRVRHHHRVRWPLRRRRQRTHGCYCTSCLELGNWLRAALIEVRSGCALIGVRLGCVVASCWGMRSSEECYRCSYSTVSWIFLVVTTVLFSILLCYIILNSISKSAAIPEYPDPAVGG
jgi:hypothetical protein